MNAFLQRIINAISRWFERTKTPKVVRKRTFIIREILRNDPEPRLNKKRFRVENIEFDRTPESAGNGSGKFTVAGKTRPKQCPYCRTRNDLEQQADRKWRCRACDHKW